MAITSLLPLFRDQANSVAMIRHSMDVIKTAVDILNPGQVPVITADQPLYTLAKQIQWNWPQTHGEDYFVILFAGFHIEKASFNTLGDLLVCSGWTEALVQAGVATPGTADYFIKAAHVRALDGLTRSQLVFCISFDRKVTPNTVPSWTMDTLQCQ